MHISTFDFLRFFIGAFCWILTWCVALWRGSKPERWTAILTIIATVVSGLAQNRDMEARFNPGMFFPYLAMLVWYLYLSFTSGRIWPVVAAAFQSLCLLIDLSVFTDFPIHEFVRRTMNVLAGYLVLVAIQGGLAENEIRRWRAKYALAVHKANNASPVDPSVQA